MTIPEEHRPIANREILHRKILDQESLDRESLDREILDREASHVELVDDTGRAIGVATVADAHHYPGLAHRAFSVLLVDQAGQVLLQRRAAVKTRFALRWANACCGHPLPRQGPKVAARERLAEELGLPSEVADLLSLTEVGVHRYRAVDAGTGRVEHEYDHVLVGTLPPGTALAPNPAEVDDLRWLRLDLLLAQLATARSGYAPWLPGVVEAWRVAAASGGSLTDATPARASLTDAIPGGSTVEGS